VPRWKEHKSPPPVQHDFPGLKPGFLREPDGMTSQPFAR
jgi:hypothetical protein